MTTDDLVSVRGLVDSDFDLPVRSFDGIFAGYEQEPARGYEGTRINLNFNEIENLVTVAPYNLPTVTLNIGQSNKNKSRWGYFGNSLAELLAPDEDIKDCKGRRFSMAFCDGLDGRPEPKPIWQRDAQNAWRAAQDIEAKLGGQPTVPLTEGEKESLRKQLQDLGPVYPDGQVPTPVWVVTAVDGALVPAAGEDTSISAAEWAEQNLAGKTRGDFNKWAFADPRVRKDLALQRSITDKSFINSLLQLGRVVEDENGVFQSATPAAEEPVPPADASA